MSRKATITTVIERTIRDLRRLETEFSGAGPIGVERIALLLALRAARRELIDLPGRK